jgi:hypothetical protein
MNEPPHFPFPASSAASPDRLSPNSIASRLIELSKLLDAATKEIEELDEAAVRAKGAYQVAFARAFIEAGGAMDMRKQLAIRDVNDKWLDFELADAKVRACKERIRTLNQQIDIGRSLGAAARSEWSATNYTSP